MSLPGIGADMVAICDVTRRQFSKSNSSPHMLDDPRKLLPTSLLLYCYSKEQKYYPTSSIFLILTEIWYTPPSVSVPRINISCITNTFFNRYHCEVNTVVLPITPAIPVVKLLAGLPHTAM